MNTYAISAKYARLAIFPFLIAFCGQTARAEMSWSWPEAGAAISLLSALIRYVQPRTSPLGLALDAACALGHIYQVSSARSNAASRIFDFGCIGGLVLQFTDIVPGLKCGFQDPLEQARAAIGLTNICIIASRLLNRTNTQH